MTYVVVIKGGGCWSTYENYLQTLRERDYSIERLLSTDWKDHLAAKLPGMTVVMPEMPNRQNAVYAEWEIVFEKIAQNLTDGTVLVGHSLGGVFLAKYLATHELPFRPASTHLVAAPFTGEGRGEEIRADFVPPSDLTNLATRAGSLYLYHSQDDHVVSVADFEKYRELLPNATARLFEDRGHFKQAEFPEVVEDIRAAL